MPLGSDLPPEAWTIVAASALLAVLALASFGGAVYLLYLKWWRRVTPETEPEGRIRAVKTLHAAVAGAIALGFVVGPPDALMQVLFVDAALVVTAPAAYLWYYRDLNEAVAAGV